MCLDVHTAVICLALHSGSWPFCSASHELFCWEAVAKKVLFIVTHVSFSRALFPSIFCISSAFSFSLSPFSLTLQLSYQPHSLFSDMRTAGCCTSFLWYFFTLLSLTAKTQLKQTYQKWNSHKFLYLLACIFVSTIFAFLY